HRIEALRQGLDDPPAETTSFASFRYPFAVVGNHQLFQAAVVAGKQRDLYPAPLPVGKCMLHGVIDELIGDDADADGDLARNLGVAARELDRDRPLFSQGVAKILNQALKKRTNFDFVASADEAQTALRGGNRLDLAARRMKIVSGFLAA